MTTTLATESTTTVEPLELLRFLHQRRQLLPVLHQALTEKLVLEAARDEGFTIDDEQLQQAVNGFRLRQGLTSVETTQRWLALNQFTLLDLQDAVEADLLRQRFREHLVDTQGPEYLALHEDRYARARLGLLVSPSEGECRERLAQIEEEGADFADLARRHSLHASRATGGDLGVLFRCQLPPNVGDAIFLGAAGRLVGPLTSEGGFCLYQVVDLQPAELDDRTRVLVGQHLLAEWVRQRLTGARVDLSWLRSTDEPV